MDNNLLNTVVSGIFVLSGVLVGSSLSRNSARSQDDRRMLAEFYAEVFARYFACVPEWNTTDITSLVASVEKTKLLCSEDSAKILNELVLLATETTVSYEQCGACISRLRVSSKDDIQKK